VEQSAKDNDSQNDNNWYRYSFLQAQPDPLRAMKKNKNLLPELETGSFIVWILIGKNNEMTDRIIPLKKKRSQGHMAKQKRKPRKSPPKHQVSFLPCKNQKYTGKRE
jgi:hypothetical protein